MESENSFNEELDVNENQGRNSKFFIDDDLNYSQSSFHFSS